MANACARVAVARFLEKACCQSVWIWSFFLACLTRKFQIVSAHQGSMMGYVRWHYS